MARHRKALEACCQYNDNLIIMLVIPVVLPDVEGYLVVHPWVEEVKHPQIFFFLAQVTQLGVRLLMSVSFYMVPDTICCQSTQSFLFAACSTFYF
jgi:hypothetical protein